MCRVVNYTSSGEKVLKINHNSTISGTVGTHSLSTWKMTVKPVMMEASTLLVNSIVSPYSGILRVCTAEYQATVTGTTAPTRDYGSCFGSMTRSGTGVYAQPINSGMFSAVPTCIVSNNAGTSNANCIVNGAATTTSVPVSCWDGDDGTAVDGRPTIICIGPK